MITFLKGMVGIEKHFGLANEAHPDLTKFLL